MTKTQKPCLTTYYTHQEVRGENITIIDNTKISAILAHRPVLADTVVVEVFETEADANNTNNDTPYLRVSFDNESIAVVRNTGGLIRTNIIVDIATTKFDPATGQVQIMLSAGSFPVGAVGRVNYEYDIGDIQVDLVHERLVAFLYLLMRDEMPSGRVCNIINMFDEVEQTGEPPTGFQFTSPHLEALARDYAGRIKEGG